MAAQPTNAEGPENKDSGFDDLKTFLEYQNIINESNFPTVILDFRLKDAVEDRSRATIRDVLVRHNTACDKPNFKAAYHTLLSEKLERDPNSDNKILCLNEETLLHNVRGDVWNCLKGGPYRVWSFRAPPKMVRSNDTGTSSESTFVQSVESLGGVSLSALSREETLYNRLLNMQAPLQAFSDLTSQALKDVELANRSVRSETESADASAMEKLTARISKQIEEIELNLRTISSGLSLLKDLSNISDIPPPPPSQAQVSALTPPSIRHERSFLNSIRDNRYPYQKDISNRGPWSQSMPENIRPYVADIQLLIVEDNKVNQRLMYKISEKLGVSKDNIWQAYDGVEGLEVLETMEKNGQFPEIMLVDMCMPRMDGFTFLDEFRVRWPHSRVKVVMLIAYAMLGDAEKIRKAGADGLIQKPMKIKDIGIQLEKLARIKLSRNLEFRGKL